MSDIQPKNISRRDLLRYSGLGIAAVGGGALLSACSTTEPGTGEPQGEGDTGPLMQRAEDGDPIRIAVGNEPPYTQLQADGTVTGASPDVTKAVLERMGYTNVEGVEAAYDSMIPGLDADRWDIVSAGLFMNQSRCAEVLYASPDIVSTESLAVPAGNPKNLTTMDDVMNSSDVTVAVLQGSFELKGARAMGVEDGKLDTYPRAPDALQAMNAGRVDAIILPTLSLQSLKEQQSADFEISEPLDAYPLTGAGAAFRESDEDFHAAFNEEMEAFKKTDEFASILEEWGFDPQAAREATVEELCKTEG